MAEQWKDVDDLHVLAIESLQVSEEDWADEKSGKKWHGMIITMPVQQGDIVNQNKRKYPWNEVLKPALEDYDKAQVQKGWAYLHADHNNPLGGEDPTTRMIRDDRTAALMVTLECRESDKTGVAKLRVLDTSAGETIRKMWNAGGNIGVSSVSKIVAEQVADGKGDTYEVAKKMRLIGFDLIINPSVKKATPAEVSFERKENAMTDEEKAKLEDEAKKKKSEEEKAELKKAADAKKKLDEDEELDEFGKPLKKGKKAKSVKELREMYPSIVDEIESEIQADHRNTLRQIAEVLAEAGIVARQEDETIEAQVASMKETNTELQSKLDELERERKFADILRGFTAEEQTKIRSMLEDVPTYTLEDKAAPLLELLKEKLEAEKVAKEVTGKAGGKVTTEQKPTTTEASKTSGLQVTTEGASALQKLQIELAID